MLGNRQKKAKAMIEASGLKMIAVEDFDLAARTVRMSYTHIFFLDSLAMILLMDNLTCSVF